jgi:hypothetical protein
MKKRTYFEQWLFLIIDYLSLLCLKLNCSDGNICFKEGSQGAHSYGAKIWNSNLTIVYLTVTLCIDKKGKQKHHLCFPVTTVLKTNKKFRCRSQSIENNRD